MTIDFKWAFDNPDQWACAPHDAFDRHNNQDCRDLHYGVPWPPDDSPEWPFWADAIGQQFQAGDYISVATISGRSPVQVVAEVIRINRKNSTGALILGPGRAHYETETGGLPAGMDWQSPNKPRFVRIPGCTVTAKPVYSRFQRIQRYDYNTHQWVDHVRNSTYKFIENIVLLDSHAANVVKARCQVPTPAPPY